MAQIYSCQLNWYKATELTPGEVVFATKLRNAGLSIREIIEILKFRYGRLFSTGVLWRALNPNSVQPKLSTINPPTTHVEGVNDSEHNARTTEVEEPIPL